MKFGIIYKITNKINNKIYIGFSTYSAEARFKKHVSTAKCSKRQLSHFHKAINKYGSDSFIIETICSVLKNEENAEWIEDYFINLYNSMDKNVGYNMIMSQANGITKELRKKSMEEDWKNNPKREQQRKKMSERGKTPEALKYLSKIRQEWFDSPESKEILSNHAKSLWATGKLSKQSLKERLEKRWADPNEREKQRKIGIESNLEKQRKIVGVCILDGSIKKYNSFSESHLEFNPSSVMNSLQERDVTGQGYIWIYDNGQSDEEFKQIAKIRYGRDFKTEFKKPIIGRNKNTGKIIEFDEIKEVEKIGLKVKEVSRCLKEPGRSCRGWTWKYKT